MQRGLGHYSETERSLTGVGTEAAPGDRTLKSNVKISIVIVVFLSRVAINECKHTRCFSEMQYLPCKNA